MALIVLLVGPMSVLAQEGGDEVETFVSEDELLTFDYPAGWQVREGEDALFDYVMLAPSEEILDYMPETNQLLMGDMMIQVSVLPLDIFLVTGLDLTEEYNNAADLLSALLDKEEWGEPEVIEFDVNEDETIEVAHVEATFDFKQDSTYCYKDGDLLFIVSIIVYPGELTEEVDAWGEIVITSIEYTGTSADLLPVVTDLTPTEDVQ
jgi:hypothetical protein